MLKISDLEKNIDDYLNDDNLYGIFNVYDENLSEMARVGKVPESQFEVHIEGKEGFIPHMHICRKSRKVVVLRIKLLTNEYFREKDDRMNTLNSSEKKALNKYLTSPFNTEFNISNWQHACMLWNQYNSAHQIKNIKSLTQPDYTTINEPKK